MTLEITWFLLWGLLWAIYFMLDGFDFGLGTLLPFIAKNETERRIVYNAAGPFWDGNEVWLITAGGVTFAAFPTAYAVLFSALYAPLLILLFALIFRAVSFEFRNKIDSPFWRKVWDLCQFLGNVLPAILLGVAFANLFMGIPIDGQGVYHGTLLTLLNPYGLAGGLLFLIMFALHGSLWLAVKSTSTLHERAVAAAKKLWPVLLVLALFFLLLSMRYTALWDNYWRTPALLLVPVAAVAALLSVRVALGVGRAGLAWICSAVFIVTVTFFGILGMFPNLVPSSLNPEWSISMLNGASSTLTLKIMLGVVIVFVPIVLIYQAWMYSVFTHKLTKEELENGHSY